MGALPERSRMTGVWSATPTPFTADGRVDPVAAQRLVEHHVRLGVRGLFLCGTCGEGPWMTDEQRGEFIRAVADAAGGRLTLAAQVTDNSARRILRNIEAVRDAGAEIAVIAPPYFLLNSTPENVLATYREAIRQSHLPVGIYDRGAGGAVPVPDEILGEIYAEDNVVMVKDSSSDPGRRRIALEARTDRPQLALLTGNEFDCVAYLRAGYDGLLLGGGIFNGKLAARLMSAAGRRDWEAAETLQQRMNRLMWDVYGGRQIACWLSGLKYLLVEMGVFRTTAGFLRYPLTPECRAAVKQAMNREAEVLGLAP
ncbi:MAG: dihydrodipicolinate synthase family protein [Kiritimatiellaeota bacterium]|nr:dihydrodipicolinate synthase family protein [Kiritimatiellota bacterium]